LVNITDARCYSATDIFYAGFADHRIGPVLGVDANTGAGGANVWTHGLLHQLVTTREGVRSPYRDLPGEVDMRVAIRRTLRWSPRSMSCRVSSANQRSTWLIDLPPRPWRHQL